MAGFTYSTLTTAIQNYTEVGTGVLSSTITDQFIDNSELRIQREIPIDADRKEMLGNLTASKDNVYAPAGTLFVRGLQVYTSTTAATGANSWLEKKDISYLRLNFGNGLLYACLVEAFSYLKGPMDMLQLYEQKYQTEVQKFGGEQIGRRRRDDYTDGEPRIPVQSPTP